MCGGLVKTAKRKRTRAHGGCLWLSEAKKDVTSCEKPRSGANTRYEPRMSEWGNPAARERRHHCKWGERGELKHLSTRRKRK